MKNHILLALIAVSFLFACSGTSVSQEEAEKAFVVSFAAVMTASFSSAFGSTPEGVVINDDGLSMELDNFDISEFEGVDYTTISGTVVNENDSLKCDLQLTGGPVKTISFEYSDLTGAEGFNLKAMVNGKENQIEISEEDLAAFGAAS